MNSTIWKYPVPIEDEFTVQLPVGAEFLSCQAQHGAPQMWFLVNPDYKKEPRQFSVRGTGQAVGVPMSVLEYLATFQVRGGDIAFHLFERRER